MSTAAIVTPTIERVFRPNVGKQTTFFSLPDSIFEALYGGAAGGGKSAALLMLPLVKGWHEHPKFHGIILRRTFPELEEYMILRSKEFYEPTGGKYNEQQKRWRWSSGAIMKFGHAEEESDIRKYDTAEYNYIGFDELTSFTEFQYTYMAFSRCRSSCPDLPALVRSGSNPGNVGHSWVRKRFVEPCKEGMKILAQKMPNGEVIKRIFIPAKATDNPHNDPGYITRMYALPEAERVAKLFGDWWTFSGQVFEEWRNEPFHDEPKEACHVTEPPVIPTWIPRVLAIDWGFQAMTYASWGAAFPNKRAILYREYAEKKKTIDQWATDLAEISIKDTALPNLVTLDPSAWQNRGHELTIAEQFSVAWRRVTGKNPPLVKADNDRLGGKMLVHDYLRWKPLPKLQLGAETYDRDIADVLLRTQGLVAYQSYLAHFAPKSTEPEVLPRLLVSKACPVMIKTIPNCVYNEKGKNVEDVAEFEGDDPYDNLRYLLKAINSYYSNSASSEKVAIEQAKVLNACADLERTQDQTSFYRKMELLESKKRNVMRGIRFNTRRFGRRVM